MRSPNHAEKHESNDSRKETAEEAIKKKFSSMTVKPAQPNVENLPRPSTVREAILAAQARSREGSVSSNKNPTNNEDTFNI